MLDLLDDPASPEFTGAFRTAVDGRIAAKRRRTRALAGAAGVFPIAVGALLLTRLPGDGPGTVVDSAVAVTTGSTAPDVSPSTTLADIASPGPTRPPATLPDGSAITVTPAPGTAVVVPPVEVPVDLLVDAVPLGDRDETLRRDEWLVPTALPDGFAAIDGHIQYDRVRNEFGEPVGDVADGAVESIYRSLGFSRPNAESALGRIEVEISDAATGREPLVNAEPGWMIDGFNASRRVGSSMVFVFSSPSAMSADEFQLALDSLVVTTRGAIEVTVIDQFGPDAVELATVDVVGADAREGQAEGTAAIEQFRLAVQGRDDGLDCFFFDRVPASGFGCADPLEFEGVMHWASRTGLRPGTSTQEIQAYGTVRDDVASVEIELMDGSVRTLEPQPAIGVYEHQVWILATTVQVDTTANPLTLGPDVRAVTAFDADGAVLALDRRCC